MHCNGQTYGFQLRNEPLSVNLLQVFFELIFGRGGNAGIERRRGRGPRGRASGRGRGKRGLPWSTAWMEPSLGSRSSQNKRSPSWSWGTRHETKRNKAIRCYEMCKQAPKPKLNQTKAALEEAYEVKQSKRWGVEFGGWGKRSTSGSFGWGKRSLEVTTPPPESEATMIHNVGVMPEDDEWAIFRGTPWGKRSLPPPEPMAPAPARPPDVVYAVRLTGADQERYVANLRPVEYYQGLINQISVRQRPLQPPSRPGCGRGCGGPSARSSTTPTTPPSTRSGGRGARWRTRPWWRG